MSSQPLIGFGRLISVPFRAPRPQSGGKRPPHDPQRGRHTNLRRSRLRARSHRWLRSASIASLGVTAIATTLLSEPAFAATQSAPLPDLSGTYRCEGAETSCAASGKSFTVTQSGSELEIKNDKGEIGAAKLTSRISLSAGPIWNMFGVLAPDNRAIQWSNGTTWRKQ